MLSLTIPFLNRVNAAVPHLPTHKVEVCVLNIQPRETGRVMAFLGRNKFEKFEKLRHCRQVRRLDGEWVGMMEARRTSLTPDLLWLSPCPAGAFQRRRRSYSPSFKWDVLAY